MEALNSDVFGVILYFLADELFKFSAEYTGPREPIPLRMSRRLLHSHGDIRYEDIDLTRTDARFYYRSDTHYYMSQRQLHPLYRVRKQALHSVFQARGVCRQWDEWIAPHWSRFYGEMVKFAPCLWNSVQKRPALDLVMQPAQRGHPLPNLSPPGSASPSRTSAATGRHWRSRSSRQRRSPRRRKAG